MSLRFDLNYASAANVANAHTDFCELRAFLWFPFSFLRTLLIFPLHFSTVFDICIRGLTQHGRGARTKDNGSMEDDDGLTQTTADPNVMDDADCPARK